MSPEMMSSSHDREGCSIQWFLR